MLHQKLAEIAPLHVAGHGLRAGAAVLVPHVRGRELAADVSLVERERLHAVGAIRYW